MPAPSVTIAQLKKARQGCLDTIAALEAHDSATGGDHSESVPILRRDIASYDRQLAKLEEAHTPPPDLEPTPIPVSETELNT